MSLYAEQYGDTRSREPEFSAFPSVNELTPADESLELSADFLLYLRGSSTVVRGIIDGVSVSVAAPERREALWSVTQDGLRAALRMRRIYGAAGHRTVYSAAIQHPDDVVFRPAEADEIAGIARCIEIPRRQYDDGQIAGAGPVRHRQGTVAARVSALFGRIRS